MASSDELQDSFALADSPWELGRKVIRLPVASEANEASMADEVCGVNEAREASEASMADEVNEANKVIELPSLRVGSLLKP